MRLVDEVVPRDQWPSAEVAISTLQSGVTLQVLEIYLRAMLASPQEPAIPWNAGTTMWRLGEPAVAIGLIVAAIELVGSQNSSVDWDLPAMNLAMARAAEAADLPDLMALGLARAKALTDGDYFADLANGDRNSLRCHS